MTKGYYQVNLFQIQKIKLGLKSCLARNTHSEENLGKI